MPPTFSIRTRVSNPSGEFGRWKVLVGAQHRLGQLLEKRGGAAFLDAGRSGDRQVGRLLSGVLGGQDRHGHPRVAANVAGLLVFGQVCRDQFIAVGRGFQCHPYDGHLRAAVGVERDQRGVGAISDELAGGVVEFHVSCSTAAPAVSFPL